MKPKSVMVIAGETSGDIYAANLVAANLTQANLTAANLWKLPWPRVSSGPAGRAWPPLESNWLSI